METKTLLLLLIIENAILFLIVVYYFIHRYYKLKQKKEANEQEVNEKKDDEPVNLPTLEKPKEKSEEENLNAFDRLLEQCWDLQKQYLYREKLYKDFGKIFCDNGILFYMQRSIGLLRYEMEKYVTLKHFRAIAGDQLLCGIFTSINSKFPYDQNISGGSFTLPDFKLFEPTMNRKTYFFNIGIGLDIPLDKEAVVKLLEKKITIKTEELKRLNEDPINIFYDQLWQKVRSSIESVIHFYDNQLEQTEDEMRLELLKQQWSIHINKIEAELRSGGIHFVYYEELEDEGEKKRLFLNSERAEFMPAVVRANDGFVLLKGRVYKK